MKLIENLIIIGLFFFRIFLIIKVLYGLHLNTVNPIAHPLSEIYWFVICMIVDTYVNHIFRTE
jgi:hypothetical protein